MRAPARPRAANSVSELGQRGVGGTSTSKVRFVTGSPRGLGRAIVEHALDAGDRVVATARNPERLADLVAEYGDRVLPVALDVTDDEAVNQAVQAVGPRSDAGTWWSATRVTWA